MDLHARATVVADPDVVFAALCDLATYPSWLTIVTRAAAEPDVEGAWSVDLAGRVGPFTKTKRVRMVRTRSDDTQRTVRFERQELDGRHHNEWILTGSATPASEVHVQLHYGGGRSLPGADLLLRQEVSNAGQRLQRYLDRLG